MRTAPENRDMLDAAIAESARWQATPDAHRVLTLWCELLQRWSELRLVDRAVLSTSHAALRAWYLGRSPMFSRMALSVAQRALERIALRLEIRDARVGRLSS